MQEKTISVFVQAIVRETATVKRFTLKSLTGQTLPAFTPGAHITTYLDTKNERLIRNYSLLNHPDHVEDYQIAVKLTEHSKGGSVFWHHHVQVGDQLEISYPKNHFLLSVEAKHHAFYAAGIGITPFLSMMAVLKQRGQTFELYYGSKSKDQCAFYQYINKHYESQTTFYFSEGEVPQRIDLHSLAKHRIGTHIYICGPEGLLQQVKETARGYGYPQRSIHYERFTAPQAAKREAFTVELHDQQKIIHVSANQTLLEALTSNGLQIPYACRVGRCGTCEVKVIEGDVEHLDAFLDETEKQENNTMLCCVSRTKSKKLVIDV